MSQLMKISILYIVLILCLVITDTVPCYYPCYAPCFQYPFYYTKRTFYTDVEASVESLTTTTTERAVVGGTTCNIWCWLRRVGLFIVRQLLADQDGTSQS